MSEVRATLASDGQSKGGLKVTVILWWRERDLCRVGVTWSIEGTKYPRHTCNHKLNRPVSLSDRLGIGSCSSVTVAALKIAERVTYTGYF